MLDVTLMVTTKKISVKGVRRQLTHVTTNNLLNTREGSHRQNELPQKAIRITENK